MNSIRRPRSRPRKDSVSFGLLWWVLVREATHTVVHPIAAVCPGERCNWRRYLARVSTYDVRRVYATLRRGRLRFRSR